MDNDQQMPDTTRAVGARGEAVAAAYLARAGYQILATNWRIAAGDLRGELDLVALDVAVGCTVVVEVKTRRHGGRGGPLAAVGPDKQRRLRRLGAAFVVGAVMPRRPLRFDVIGIVLDRHAVPTRLEHVRDAF